MRILASLIAVLVAIIALIISLSLTLSVKVARLSGERLPAELPAGEVFAGDIIIAHPGTRRLEVRTPSTKLALLPGTPWRVRWENPQVGMHVHVFELYSESAEEPIDRLTWQVRVQGEHVPPEPPMMAEQAPEEPPVIAEAAPIPLPTVEPEPAVVPEQEPVAEPVAEALPAADVSALPKVVLSGAAVRSQMPGKAALVAPGLATAAELTPHFLTGHLAQVRYILDSGGNREVADASVAALAALGASFEATASGHYALTLDAVGRQALGRRGASVVYLPASQWSLLIQATAQQGVINRGQVTWRLARSGDGLESFAILVTRNDIARH